LILEEAAPPGTEGPRRAIAFYNAAFGWTAVKWDGPFEYYLIMAGDPLEFRIDGGHMVSCKDTENNVFEPMEEKKSEQHVGSGVVGCLERCQPREGTTAGDCRTPHI